MKQTLDSRLQRATHRWAQGLLVLAAGVFLHPAWSSQVTGAGIGRVATVATPAPKPAPAPTTTSPSKRTTAASGASRAGSAATH